jgi:phage tail sheath protein FI
MENVQTRQGLYAFRVQIDDTLNTNDVIDRNQLVGKIYISPAKSIEFILLEFNITATGATFQ